MVEPGMHLNAVGGDCPGKTELHAGHSAPCAHARIVVEFEPQARIEGEIQQLDASVAVTELADVLRRCGPGRRPDATSRSSIRSASRSNDFSALRYLHRLNS